MDDENILFEEYKTSALEAMILALKDLDATGFLGVGAAREQITLMVWLQEDEDSESWWLRSVKELNPNAVYSRFLSESPTWCSFHTSANPQ